MKYICNGKLIINKFNCIKVGSKYHSASRSTDQKLDQKWVKRLKAGWNLDERVIGFKCIIITSKLDQIIIFKNLGVISMQIRLTNLNST